MINGTRTALGPELRHVTEQKSIGYSRYNALETEPALHEGTGDASSPATRSASRWTSSSNLGEQVEPVRRRAVRSAVGVRHAPQLRRQLQLRAAVRAAVRHAAASWRPGGRISGTTRFSSGFPVTLYNPTDTSLLGTFGNGVNNNLLDTPNYTPGCDLKINHDPAKGPAFNTDCFSLPALGQLGNAPRRFFYGPGIENFDLALIKRVTFDTSREASNCGSKTFNVFNHPQFYGAGAVDGNIASPTFGQIVTAAAPRFIQLAAKFTF